MQPSISHHYDHVCCTYCLQNKSIKVTSAILGGRMLNQWMHRFFQKFFTKIKNGHFKNVHFSKKGLEIWKNHRFHHSDHNGHIHFFKMKNLLRYYFLTFWTWVGVRRGLLMATNEKNAEKRRILYTSIYCYLLSSHII
jgi:hypothetical protein